MEVTNLIQLLEQAVHKHAHEKLFGTKENGIYKWITYKEFAKKVDLFRSGLSQLGVSAHDRVAIISRNSKEWAIAAYACYGLNAVFVPMYEDQHPDEWSYILNDCEASVLIVFDEKIKKKLDRHANHLPHLKHMIVIKSTEEEHSFAHILKSGRNLNVPALAPTGDDLMGLIYTSGTTGHPKGVMLTHRNVIFNCEGIKSLFDMGPGDVSLSFLPWAHIFGQVGELHSLIHNGYATAFAESVPKILENLSEVRPTVLMSVPRIFNKIYDSVQTKMEHSPKAIQQLFAKGMEFATKEKEGEKLSVIEWSVLQLAKKLVFSKIKSRFGGRLRYTMSGGAAIASEVARFIDNLDIQVFQGYGLSETAPLVACNRRNKNRIGSVGPVFPGVFVEIKPVEGNENAREGEIIVKSPGVMKGYYKLPDETAKVINEKGAFCTGDLGFIDQDGFLFITGRIKEQYKLENGKYVVPSPLEEKLKLSTYFTNVFIYGDNRRYNVGVICVNYENLKRTLANAGINEQKENYFHNEAILKILKDDIQLFQAHFKDYEKLRDFYFTFDDWTVENGMMTPSMKVKRKAVFEKYRGEIEGMFGE